MESGGDSRCNRPDSLVDSGEIPRLNVTEDPFVPVFDRRFYIFTLRGAGLNPEAALRQEYSDAELREFVERRVEGVCGMCPSRDYRLEVSATTNNTFLGSARLIPYDAGCPDWVNFAVLL